MFFTLEKAEQRIQEIAGRRYTGLSCIAPLDAMEGTNPPDEVYCGVPEKIGGKTLQIGDYFPGKDKFLWARKTVKIPEKKDGCSVVGLFNFGLTGGGGANSGFESLLSVDGHPYQAVDTNHNDVLLDPFAGKEITMTFLLWTGRGGKQPELEFNHQIKQADIGYLHLDVEELYYLCRAARETAVLLPEDSCDRTVLLDALERTFLKITWEDEDFYRTVPDALEYLKKTLAARKKESDVTVHCVGHTHIDVAWLWRLKNTREKAQRSFSTALRLMEEFPEFVFLQTQPQLYQYLKSDSPELYERIREKVKEGKWETDGGMWLEADCNISSGESLVRQFLHGIRFFEKEFGKKCEYLWLPDVFGYSWALPQILKKSGINTFMTTKISWNEFNTMPNDVFRWRGLDGSEVLTYFIQTPEESRPINARFSTYNGVLSPRATLGGWQKFRNKDLSRDVLIAYGYGDGGGGVTRDMLKMGRAMRQIPGLPNIKPDKAGNFFRGLHKSVENSDHYVQTWDGELYFEYHRGTYTSQALNKKWNRKSEWKLAETEWLSALSAQKGGEYPQEEIHRGWETILRNQFHDIIPGSSIREVYQDSRKEYEETDRSLTEIQQKAFHTLATPQKQAYTVYHFGSFARNSCVELPVSEEGVFRLEDGRELACQKTAGGSLVEVPVGAASLETVYFTPGKAKQEESPFRFSKEDLSVETPHYQLKWNSCGWLCSVFDKDFRREVLRGEGARLDLFEDKPLNYDAWNVDIFYSQKKENAVLQGAPEVVEEGPVRMVIRFRYRYRHSEFVQDVIVYRTSRRIDFAFSADWQESHRLLKSTFEFEIRSTKASYDIQYGHVERPTHWNTSWDWARFEVVGHKWADLSENNYGAAILNDCKYGYSTKDNVMAISLLRSPKMPDTSADMGRHEFTYSLLPHAGNAADSNVIEESVALNQPLHYFEGACEDSGKQMIRCEDRSVHLDALKKAEDGDGWIVRVHECRGGSCRTSLSSDYGIEKAVECNLLEEPEGTEITGGEIPLQLKPFELRTFRVWFQKN